MKQSIIMLAARTETRSFAGTQTGRSSAKSRARPSVPVLWGVFLALSIWMSQAQCFQSAPIAPVTDKCKDCYQTLRTYPDNGVDAHCDFEKGLGYHLESGSKCITNTPNGVLICQDRLEEAGK